MNQVLCVYLPHWPIDRLRRRRPELRHKPFVLVETSANRQMVTAVSPDAPPGVCAGMTLAQVRAHCADLAVAPAEAEKDARSLAALGHWLTRFSPSVAVWPPSAFCLDATGLELLFGGLPTLAARVAAALKRLNLTANIAIAPTPAAAWALAAFGKQSPLIVKENWLASISRFPPGALRLDPAAAQALRALGITSIGLLLQIPRDQLFARFGPAILLRIDQLTGQTPEPLHWLPHRAPIKADIEFDGLVESLDALHLALRQLLDEITKTLAARGLGARQLRLTLHRPYAPALEKTLSLLRPSRRAAGLFILLRHTLETMDMDHGFNGMSLSVESAQRLGDEQAALIGGEDERNAAELDHLIERLVAKFGDCVEWAQCTPAHLPERAFSYQKQIATIEKQLPVASRPLCLLPTPFAICTIVSPSETHCPGFACGEGAPVAFTYNDEVHRLLHVRGPERIAGQWWNGSGKTRDYFDVAATSGRRFWIFRVLQTSQWYLHGIFE